MNRIIVSLYEYENSGADSVRVAGYIKSFIKMGYEVVLVTSSREKIGLIDKNLSIILFNSIDEKYRISSRFINSWRLVKKTKDQYKEGDVIFSYSIPLLGFLWGTKRNVFFEVTEIPMHGGNEGLTRQLFARLYLWTIKRATGLIVITKALKNYYIKQGVSKDRIHVSNMTVDLSRFDNIQKQVVEQRYIAYCACISNHKDGVDTLIRAFAIVANKIPNIKLYLIGRFSVPKEKVFDEELIRSLNIVDKVVFSGLISSNELPQILKNAECLVLARPDNKQAKYGFPTKLGEYLLTENPVVVTSVGDIPLFLKDGESAYLAQPGGADEIAIKIEEALTSPLASKVGKLGAQVAKKNFNSDIEAQKVMDFILKSIMK